LQSFLTKYRAYFKEALDCVARKATLRKCTTSFDKKIEIEEVIEFTESNILTITKKDYGVLINTKIITKTNEGNILEKSQTTLEKNILSRLFTSFSPEPDIVERKVQLYLILGAKK